MKFQTYKKKKKKKKVKILDIPTAWKRLGCFFHLFKWKVNSWIYIVVVLYMIHKVLHTWIELQEFISLMTHVFAHGARPPPPFSTLLVWWRGEKTYINGPPNPPLIPLCSRAYKNNVHQAGGGTFAKIVRWCACWTSKTFSIPIFRTIIHPSVTILLVPFSKEKHPISLKLGAFYHSLLKIIGLLHLWWKPPIAIPNFAK